MMVDGELCREEDSSEEEEPTSSNDEDPYWGEEKLESSCDDQEDSREDETCEETSLDQAQGSSDEDLWEEGPEPWVWDVEDLPDFDLYTRLFTRDFICFMYSLLSIFTFYTSTFDSRTSEKAVSLCSQISGGYRTVIIMAIMAVAWFMAG